MPNTLPTPLPIIFRTRHAYHKGKPPKDRNVEGNFLQYINLFTSINHELRRLPKVILVRGHSGVFISHIESQTRKVYQGVPSGGCEAWIRRPVGYLQHLWGEEEWFRRTGGDRQMHFRCPSPTRFILSVFSGYHCPVHTYLQKTDNRSIHQARTYLQVVLPLQGCWCWC